MQIQSKPLQRATDQAHYKLYRAALEWDLTEPIIIESKDDLRSEQKWRDRVEPYHHQVKNLITFCRRLPVTLLADDVGLGKTISAGLVVSELVARGRIQRILIVCPKLLIPQWKEELDTKFGIPGVPAIGKELIDIELPEECGAAITTYNSARLYLDDLAKIGFDMLILDEAHKLRNLYGTDAPPKVALQFRKALEQRMFRYVLMLTATPIQNRLWDLYSLVDLLTVARGHKNPFGSEGSFAQQFIADTRTEARQLRPERREEFRSIVYGYMSRVRRADAKLHFPDRKVQLHKVPPTEPEKQLIKLIAEPIQKLNRLGQISILQALTSSPQALSRQLRTMAANGTFPKDAADKIQALVDQMQTSAKLGGLGTLVEGLRAERPDQWRMVIFTGRRETQTTIESYLDKMGIRCGIINGDSGQRNQETIGKFKKNPPDIHVIVSTEAGSEGVNLQAANVLVNYDLPWNPMIVEQRIGRIQRLASAHATVCIFNVILSGTFEEYIVGRLMEKLQMAAHAIGDVESLLEQAGMDDDEDGESSFADRIRKLVVDSLAGKNVNEETRLAEQSIAEAKSELEREEQNINSMLGSMDGVSGPRAPKLPPQTRAMDVQNFVLAAFESLGARVTERTSGVFEIDRSGRQELIRFADQGVSPSSATVYRPGSPPFERLVNQVADNGKHMLDDFETDVARVAESMAKGWVNEFGGDFTQTEVEVVTRLFSTNALLRVRATVAHDSYERLIEIPCKSEVRFSSPGEGLQSAPQQMRGYSDLGLTTQELAAKVEQDAGISEFCRFYSERLAEEIRAAGDDQRKRKKLEDDFTPRLDATFVGADGTVRRKLRLKVSYSVDSAPYQSKLELVPTSNEFVARPESATCASTGKTVPKDCLGRCEISGHSALKHLLHASESSGRLALAQHLTECSLSGKQVLSDEIEVSAITGRPVLSKLLKSSAVSGKRAEPDQFGRCDFSSADALQDELPISEVSGKRYRLDQACKSVVSGKSGHTSEFIICPETRKPLLPSEVETCEVSGAKVAPGILEVCEITGKKVMPCELAVSAVSGKKALKKLFITSSLSGTSALEQETLKSIDGKYCLQSEGTICAWSGRACHPRDIKICQLAGVPVCREFLTGDLDSRLEPLIGLLEGRVRNADKSELWDMIGKTVAPKLGNCQVDAAVLSPDNRHLALSIEVRTWMGMKKRYVGMIFDLETKASTGRSVTGRRTESQWQLES